MASPTKKGLFKTTLISAPFAQAFQLDGQCLQRMFHLVLIDQADQEMFVAVFLTD